ncbi:NACHT domain-containing protein [Coleofasciculus sp. E1-EBD-02]|uniref:NACHT domain-containing protein n=1 Tax=Coleofasciculus sp. E1-EBD-02 TaxID=3068481 RepID=UPI0032F1DF0B
MPKTKAALYEQFTRAFYDWKDEKITTISTKRKELNEKLALLAREAIDEEKSRFAIRESFALDVMGEDLFNSACKLHWLIHVYNDADTNEKVYAFFHPTFQEYFAALAVYDWEFFLPRAHDNPNPKPVSDRYRIFEPQWKEVILLWLGRPDEEVTKEQKEAFIKKLVNFKDGCTELFYRYQAYFLAAAGIAEFNDFSDCNTSNHIVNEIVKWSFGQTYQVKFPYPHTQESKSPKFVENAAKSMLIETDCKLVITKLSNLLDEEGRSEQNIFEVSSFLLQLSQGNFKAIKKFKYLIQNSQSTEVRKWASLKFLESTPDESDPMFDCAYKILLEPIGGGITRETWERNWEHWTNWSSNRPNCGEDALSRLLSIAREAYNKQNQLENQTKKFILSDMLLKGTTIQEQVQELIEIMETGRNPELHITYIHHLSYIGHGNKKAIQQLIKIVRAYKNQDFYYAAIEGLGLIGIGSREAFDCLLEVIDQGIVPTTAIWSMKNILGGDLFDLAVRQLKHQFLLCYPVIWYCAQNMSYSAFHQAWCE